MVDDNVRLHRDAALRAGRLLLGHQVLLVTLRPRRGNVLHSDIRLALLVRTRDVAVRRRAVRKLGCALRAALGEAERGEEAADRRQTAADHTDRGLDVCPESRLVDGICRTQEVSKCMTRVTRTDEERNRDWECHCWIDVQVVSSLSM